MTYNKPSIPTEDWMVENIPENNTHFDAETWREIVVETRKGCVTRARRYKALDRKLTLKEETDLAASWCCGDLPHPPIYYFPQVHAEEFVPSIGFDMGDSIIVKSRATCPVCQGHEKETG